MDRHDPLDSIGTSEFHGLERQTSHLDDRATDQPGTTLISYSKDPSGLPDAGTPDFIQGFKDLTSRFFQLCLRPEGLVPIVLDSWSSIQCILWTDRRPGVDFLYPLSNLKIHKSGRLARLLLEYTRDLPLRDLHTAVSPSVGTRSPRVAVMDLDEVPPEIIQRGYAVPADSYGFAVMILLLDILAILLLPFSLPNLFSIRLAHHLFGFLLLCILAAGYGDGTLTIIWRSHKIVPTCAIFLDCDFALVLVGTHRAVEAIAESGFGISPWSTYNLDKLAPLLSLPRILLEALCYATRSAILMEIWILMVGTGHILTVVVTTLEWVHVYVVIHRFNKDDRTHPPRSFFEKCGGAACKYVFMNTPIRMLYLLHQPNGDPTIGQLLGYFLTPLAYLSLYFLIHYRRSSRQYRIRTVKLLEILGSPPVRRWEFDTLAAAVTFQCLVLFRGVPRPISVDILTLLDTFVPDDTDVWKVWKARVADRIMHEEDILFAPTIPSFSDHRQVHLKELLDQAQLGYGIYRRFYDGHVPLYSQKVAS